MNIIERGRAFVQSLRELASRSVWDWRRCPRCGSAFTHKNGSYVRRPWTLNGRQEVRVQRHLCRDCGRTHSERSPLLGQSFVVRSSSELNTNPASGGLYPVRGTCSD